MFEIELFICINKDLALNNLHCLKCRKTKPNLTKSKSHRLRHVHTHTHTHIYIYIYVYINVDKSWIRYTFFMQIYAFYCACVYKERYTSTNQYTNMYIYIYIYVCVRARVCMCVCVCVCVWTCLSVCVLCYGYYLA